MSELTRGSIEKNGVLYIDRAKTPKAMFCCHDKMVYCGDSCPHFHEPITSVFSNTIELCGGTVWRFAEFEDKRK